MTEITFQYYTVACIDVLGQKENLEELEELLNNREIANPNVLKAKQKTIDVICNLRKTFLTLFKEREYSNPNDPKYCAFSDEQKKQFAEIRSNSNIRFISISDSILIYAPLAKVKGQQRVQDVFTMVGAVASVLLDAFATGIPMRGGIDLGYAAKIEDQELDPSIYGPVLNRVHYLESEVAQYPRIVVGNDLIRYLELISTTELNLTIPQNAVNKAFAEQLRKLIFRDVDGEHAIDFLGEFMQQTVEELGQMKTVNLAFEFIEREYRRLYDSGNFKLALRYRMLWEYCNDSLANWPAFQKQFKT